MSSSINFFLFLFLIILINASLLNQPTQYILVFNILKHIILFLIVYLKFRCNMSGTLIHFIKQYKHFLKLSFDLFITCVCCINTGSFSVTSKAVTLLKIYIVLSLQNKTFAGRVQKNCLNTEFFSPNMGKYGAKKLCIWTLFTQCLATIVVNLLKIWLPYCGFPFPSLN